MKKQPEKIQEGEKSTLESIQEVTKAIEIFFGQQKENRQWDPYVNIEHIKGVRASSEAVAKNGFSCISKHITQIQLPGFTTNEFILAKETFSHKEKPFGEAKYDIQFGYLWQIADLWKTNIKSYTKPDLLCKAKENCFASYIELEIKHENDKKTSFVIVSYAGSLYLCLNGTRIFQCNANTIHTHPNHVEGGDSITTNLYMEKTQALREKIQQDVIASRKIKSQSSEIANLLKNLEF
ncbi:MAG: hypothetical protein WC004_04600 [Candidatus Absconditabacterales bacterium]